MEDTFLMDVGDCFEELIHVELDFPVSEFRLPRFETFIQVHVHQLKYQSQLAYVKGSILVGSS